MEKKIQIEKIKISALKAINGILTIFTATGAIIIMTLHFDENVSFFPILFLFDLYFFYGDKLFLEKVIKIKWSERADNEATLLKYIVLPMIFIEALVILYYYKYTFPIIKEMAENFMSNHS